MIVAIIILLLILPIFIVSYYCYKQVFYNDNKNFDVLKVPYSLKETNIGDEFVNNVKAIMEMEYKPYTIKAYDGLELNAKYFHFKDNAPLQIFFHGYKSADVRDFSGGMNIAKKANHNVLLIEQRGHGKSKSNTITFGIKERRDCLSWCKFAVEEFGSDIKIILVGVSMGGATVTSASNLGLPENVKVIIADSPFSSPKDIILKVCKDQHIPLVLAYPFIAIGGFLYAHINFFFKGSKGCVKETNIPLMVIHGDNDTFVPCEMGKLIYENCNSDKELHIFEGAEHAISYYNDKERYYNVIEQFTNKYL